MVFVYFDLILFERFYQEYYQSEKYFLQNKKKSVDSISKENTILLRDTIEESVKFQYSKYGWLNIMHLSNSTVTCNMAA